jgi:hypothetical protein
MRKHVFQEEGSHEVYPYSWPAHRHVSIDYRYEDGGVWVSTLCFPAVKQGLIQEYEAEESTYLDELDVRKPLVAFISQRSEELRLYSLVQILTISNPGLKALSLNASPG